LPRGRPRNLRSILTDVGASLGLEDPVERVLHERWPEAVGADLAALCGPEKLARGKLTVEVADPVVKYEMFMRRENLRERLNSWLGKEHIREVHVRLRKTRGC
jgi:hypothetical protein